MWISVVVPLGLLAVPLALAHLEDRVVRTGAPTTTAEHIAPDSRPTVAGRVERHMHVVPAPPAV